MAELRAALACQALGLSVIPVKRDKKPLIEWRPHMAAAADTEQIKRWWKQFPDAEIGVVTGFLSGVFVLDIDGDLGAETIADLQRKHGPLPRTWRSRTGKGEHVWFRFPTDIELRNTAGGIAPGLDTRGEGGYVVAPGSMHANGNLYEWQDDAEPSLVELAHLPEWLLELVKKKPAQPEQAKPNGHTPHDGRFDLLRRIFEEERNDLAKLFKGNRNHALNAAAYALGQLSHYAAWTEEEARAALQAACMANGYYYSTDPGDGAKGFDATWKSGWTAGCAAPRELKERETYEDRRRDRAMRHIEPSTYQPPESEPVVNDWAKRLDLSDLENIPPRQWLYGVKLIRGFTTLLASPGGVGKTAFTFAVALSCATGEELLHDKPHAPLNVWLYNLEDPYDELRRRLAAILRHHNGAVDRTAVEQRLFINSGRDRRPDGALGLLIAEKSERDTIAICPDADALVAELVRLKIDVLIIDPFIMTHQVEENSNADVERVLREFNRIAQDAGCAILLIHHSRKGFVSGDQDSIRGGSAMVGAARAAFTLAPMLPEEAEKLNVPAEERRFLVRVDDAKMNMAPKSDKAQWIKLVSVNIGNGLGTEYPKGDNVQVATLWMPPEKHADLTIELANEILDEIDRGQGDERYSIQRNCKHPAVGLIVSMMAAAGHQKSDAWARGLIKDWLTATPPVITEGEYENSQRKVRKGLFANNSNRPGSRHD